MTTVLLVAFFACMAALCVVLVWQHRTILRLAREVERDNVIKVRLREELWALAEKHHDAVPIVYFLGIASDIRTDYLEEFADKVAELGAILANLGVSTTDRDQVLRPLWNFLDAQIAKEPAIPGVQYVRAAGLTEVQR